MESKVEHLCGVESILQCHRYKSINLDSICMLTFIAGINKGSGIFLHILKELNDKVRRVAFFHRNSSDSRKEAILRDLQLPIGSSEKQLICVVATVSLGNNKRYLTASVICHFRGWG